MSACEICWQRAQGDAFFRGGSQVEHYLRRIAEPNPDHEQETLEKPHE